MKNKINVNISPNPLGQTLHCSQNDTGERKFYFTLHNNGEVIDTTDISDPIFEPFDVYKGGTEQLLPVNTGVPTTSPIIADIQYPDEEKTEQEFTYRESPTTIDGKALIEKLYGNTLVWNQLAKTLSSSNYSAIRATASYSNGVCTITTTWANTICGIYITSANFGAIVGHKYLFMCTVNPSITKTFRLGFDSSTTLTDELPVTANKENLLARIQTASSSDALVLYLRCDAIGDTAIIKNVMAFDLTKMFGVGREPTTVDQFTALYSLPYYKYDAGSLLSFNGTGIKTTGKNLLEPYTLANLTDVTVSSDNGTYTLNGTTTAFRSLIAPDSFFVNPGTYTLSKNADVLNAYVGVQIRSADGLTTYITTNGTGQSYTFVERTEIKFRITIGAGQTLSNYVVRPQLELGSPATSYTEYIESTTSIPVSTYFPTGMKSAGDAYDELTSNKATTRIGVVDLGSINDWYMWTTGVSGKYRMMSASLLNLAKRPPTQYVSANIKCAIYDTVPNVNTGGSSLAKGIALSEGGYLQIHDPDFDTQSSLDGLKAKVNGVMLQYELEEEQVTEFTHASLICEDGESTLYQDDDSLVCDCTEDFSKDSGFKDCKIKFTNDDEVIYSNKIQLHIERKP